MRHQFGALGGQERALERASQGRTRGGPDQGCGCAVRFERHFVAGASGSAGLWVNSPSTMGRDRNADADLRALSRLALDLKRAAVGFGNGPAQVEPHAPLPRGVRAVEPGGQAAELLWRNAGTFIPDRQHPTFAIDVAGQAWGGRAGCDGAHSSAGCARAGETAPDRARARCRGDRGRGGCGRRRRSRAPAPSAARSGRPPRVPAPRDALAAPRTPEARPRASCSPRSPNRACRGAEASNSSALTRARVSGERRSWLTASSSCRLASSMSRMSSAMALMLAASSPSSSRWRMSSRYSRSPAAMRATPARMLSIGRNRRRVA